MDLSSFFNGFVKNYSVFNLHRISNITQFTAKEIGYFRQLGEMLGYHVFHEDQRMIKGMQKKGDLFWATYDKDDDEYYYELHLERESKRKKAKETIVNKLADDISFLIGIVHSNTENATELIELAKKKVEENKEVDEILLILIIPVAKEKKDAITLILGVYFWKDKKKVKSHISKAIRLTNEAGYYYGLIEKELTEEEWKRFESRMIDYNHLVKENY